jgi:hypothetical protein
MEPVDTQKLDQIVEPQQEAGRPPKSLRAKFSCKLCKHEKRAEIEAIWLKFHEIKTLPAIVKAVNQQYDPNLHISSFKTHFGLFTDRKTGKPKKSHFIGDIVASDVSSIIQEKANKMIEERAADVAVEDIKAGIRRVGFQWLQQIEGNPMRIMMLDDKVGASLLAKAIDADFDEKALALKRSQGNQMNQILLGQLGMMAAIFGSKKPAEFIDGSAVEPVEKLPEGRANDE